MGKLIDGVWTQEGYAADDSGRFVRDTTTFRGRIAPEDARPERYHLYVSLACPWAHRTLIARALLGLTDAITVAVVHPHMLEHGWTFAEFPGSTPDPVSGARFLWEVYAQASPGVTARVTVPILFDKERRAIVNNESREIVTLFDEVLSRSRYTLLPPAKRAEIDAVADELYPVVNNGVYRAGFATSQAAYDEAVTALFAALDRWEAHLSRQRFLCGEHLTAADVFLFTTLFRFDPVYVTHFKCNVRRIEDYPALSGFVRDVYATPGVRETCDLLHIKEHYFRSHPFLNPRRIVPAGPVVDLDRPHGRERLGAGGLTPR